jgi:hypothetical protein
MNARLTIFKILFLFISQFLFLSSEAVNPTLSIKVIPDFPTENDNVKIVVKAYYVAAATKVGIGFERYGNQIIIKACDKVIFGYSATYEFVDTLNLGKLHIGIYTISHKRIQWNIVDSCSSGYFFLSTDSFEVFQSTGQLENKFLDNKISIYPNSNYGLINIENETSNEITEIYLFDIYGKQIDDFDPEKFLIDISNLESGVYTLQIKMIDGMYRKRIVKQ